MTDIVERLRLDAEPTESDMEEAATEIERLRKKVSWLRQRAARDVEQIISLRIELGLHPVGYFIGEDHDVR